ncbi:MAG TPA: hypothetical protein VNT26_05415 [Candidatus Sulfotelmatobacter sp.]|nr:hypothetical protein [Candidatus Sulfotelmatobacter sp.]HWI59277.1 hypothetical protein [Bacillota bacterium]
MIRVLQSSWVVSVVSCLLYWATTAVLLKPAHFEGARPAAQEVKFAAGEEPSWRFRNPEFEQWVEELKREKEELATREQQLRELQTRLEAERQEILSVTQTVHQVQMEFDRNVIRFKEQELQNLKRQAKVISVMSPEGAAAMLNEMSEQDLDRILFTLKPDNVSVILDSMSKMGKTEAKRAAELTERMRRILPPDPANARAGAASK